MAEKDMSRRRFLALTFWGTGGLCLLNRCNLPSSSWRVFSNEEACLLDALVEQIIPADDEWPGAKDAHVTNYIDRQLAGFYSKYQEDYKTGLAAIQKSALKRFNKKFEEVEFDIQTSFLREMETGKFDKEDEWWDQGQGRRFFNVLCDHTMQGFYGSPRHGGNYKNISYKMLKLDYPDVVGQSRIKQS